MYLLRFGGGSETTTAAKRAARTALVLPGGLPRRRPVGGRRGVEGVVAMLGEMVRGTISMGGWLAML